jgi:glycosyltransferase involved in cell wall biosynthesis
MLPRASDTFGSPVSADPPDGRVPPVVVRDLTVVVPAFNEARRIGPTLDQLLAWGAAHCDRFEVIVVDDGSTDGTAALVEGGWKDRALVLRRPKRGGKGAAVRAGVAAAKTTWVLLADADLSIPIEELEKLSPFATENALVIGSKRAPGSDLAYPPLRRFLGGIGQQLISLFVVSGFHDTQCGFKLFRADVAKELFALQRLDGFGYDFEVLFLARRYGHSVREVPVRCAHQLGSTVRLGSYWNVLVEVFTVLANRARGVYPEPRRVAASERAR